MLSQMLVCRANHTHKINQQCWPTLTKQLLNVGQHFESIFCFVVRYCNSRQHVGEQYWPTCLDLPDLLKIVRIIKISDIPLKSNLPKTIFDLRNLSADILLNAKDFHLSQVNQNTT